MERIEELLEEARVQAGQESDWDNDTDARTRARFALLLLIEAVTSLVARQQTESPLESRLRVKRLLGER